MSVLAEERKKIILDELKLAGKVMVVDLARRFNVSAETIRRDLDILQEEGLLKRVYGGAVRKETLSVEPPFYKRTTICLNEKRRIAQRAAQLVEDGDVLAIDAGTTMLEFARALRNKQDITVITPSLPVTAVISEAINRKELSGEIFLLGGKLNPQQQTMSGSLTEKNLRNFCIDKAFISVGGVSLSDGITDFDLSEALVSRAMIEAASEILVLADHTKMDARAKCRIDGLDAVDVIVSDKPMPDAWQHEDVMRHIRWFTAREA